jgi:pyridoxal phosphate enzyme (YggS family)
MDQGTESFKDIRAEIKIGVRLVAVSKTKPAEKILEIYKQGQRDFGENKVQEMVAKAEALPSDIIWHMIGHLQTNKVKYIAPFVSYIHGVDSEKLLSKINNEALKNERKIHCLLQMHIAEEESKFGFSEEELNDFTSNFKPGDYEGVIFAGVMGMATFTDNMQQVRMEFRKLKGIFDKLKKNVFPEEAAFKEISMGMSDDYKIAIEEGATMVRIGSLIFGARNYTNSNN